jgi:hypothetical protein
MPRTRARKQRSRKNRTRRGGEYGVTAPISSYSSTAPISPYSSTAPISSYSSTAPNGVGSKLKEGLIEVGSTASNVATSAYQKTKEGTTGIGSWLGLWGGRRKRRGGFKPYDPLQTTYGSAKGGRRRKTRKSRKSRKSRR